MDNELLAAAIKAGEEGKIEDWLHSFLLSSGDNKELSEGLKGEPRHWIGPVQVELAKLERIIGPEPGMEYNESQSDWDRRVGEMVSNIKNGWTPPPLIVEFKNNIFKIRDGGHRYAALLQSNHDQYWAIAWANTQGDYEQLEPRLNSIK